MQNCVILQTKMASKALNLGRSYHELEGIVCACRGREGERGGEGLDLVLAQQPLHEHLLEHAVVGQARGALVLVERTQQAGALRPRGGEDGVPEV